VGETVEVLDSAELCAEEVEVVATTSRSVADKLDTDAVVVALGGVDALAFCETDPVIVEFEIETTVEKLDTPDVEVERVALSVIEVFEKVEADAVDDKSAETDVVEESPAIEDVVLRTVIVADVETFRVLEGPLVLNEKSLENVDESIEPTETLALTLSVAVAEELLLGVEAGLCTAVELVEELLRSEAVLVELVLKTEAELVVGPSVDGVEEIAELDEVLEVS
jgi:hypothetical protein